MHYQGLECSFISVVIFLRAPRRRLCLHFLKKRSALIIGKSKVEKTSAYLNFQFNIVTVING